MESSVVVLVVQYMISNHSQGLSLASHNHKWTLLHSNTSIMVTDQLESEAKQDHKR